MFFFLTRGRVMPVTAVRGWTRLLPAARGRPLQPTAFATFGVTGELVAKAPNRRRAVQSDRGTASLDQETRQVEGAATKRFDLAPKFYPVSSSLQLVDLPEWAVVATGAGAEPSA